MNAPATVKFWAELAHKNGADDSIVGAALAQVEVMKEWQAQNGNKVPDMPVTDIPAE